MSVIATPGSAGGRGTMKELNVIGTMQLLAACQKAPGLQQLVVKSTTTVYGASSRDPAMFTEDMEPRRLPGVGLRQGRRRGRGLRPRLRPPAPRRPRHHAARAPTSSARDVVSPITSVLPAAGDPDGARLRRPAAVPARGRPAAPCCSTRCPSTAPAPSTSPATASLMLSQALRRLRRPVGADARLRARAASARSLRQAHGRRLLARADRLPDLRSWRRHHPDARGARASSPPYTTAEAFADFAAALTAAGGRLEQRSSPRPAGPAARPVQEPPSADRARHAAPGGRPVGDAEIIPIGTRGRPGRGSGNGRPSARLARPRRRGAAAAVGPGDQADATAAGPAPSGPAEDAGRDAATDEPSAPARTGPTPPEAGPAEPGRDAPRRRPGGPRRAREPRPCRASPPPSWLAAFQRAPRRRSSASSGSRSWPQFLAFLRRRVTGDYEVDEYGFDPELTERFFMAALRPIAEKWFRIEVRGVENIPAEGGALVVSNHSGTMPVDGADDHGRHPRPRPGRYLRPLGADLVFRLPVVSDAGPQGRRHAGLQRGRRADAARRRAGRGVARGLQGHRQAVLRALQAAALRPRRLRLGRHAHRGADRAAARWSAPRRSTRWSATSPSLARLLGVPYIPITPFFPLLGPLGLVPLPSQVAASSSASRSAPTSTTPAPPTTRCWSSTSPTRCARRSSRRSTRC